MNPSIVFLFLILFFASNQCDALEEVFCSFSATQMVEFNPDVDSSIGEKPFADVLVYVFKKTDGTGGFKLIHDGPNKTDDTGKCDFKFTVNEKYYLYFSGRTLGNNELTELEEHGDLLTIELLISIEQPVESQFVAKENSGDLSMKLKYSLPLWITHLQKLEAELVDGDDEESILATKNLVSQIRMLFFAADERWQTIIRPEATDLVAFDSSTGDISSPSEPLLLLCEAISFKYSRRELAYVLDAQQRRTLEERFDFVSMPDESIIQLGRVFTGLDSELFPPSQSVGTEVLDAVATVTWSRDLARAAMFSIADSAPHPPSNSQWNSAAERWASVRIMKSNIAAAGNAASLASSIKAGNSLSRSLELLFLGEGYYASSKEKFVARYKLEEAATRQSTIEPYVNSGARYWYGDQWLDLHFTTSQNLKQRSYLRLEGFLK